jgi:hypothetical protein
MISLGNLSLLQRRNSLSIGCTTAPPCENHPESCRDNQPIISDQLADLDQIGNPIGRRDIRRQATGP